MHAFHATLPSIIDYQHDPSDVVGAALLGTMIALVSRVRLCRALDWRSDAYMQQRCHSPLLD